MDIATANEFQQVINNDYDVDDARMERLAQLVYSIPQPSWRWFGRVPAPFTWLLKDPVPLVEPIRMAGRLRLWEAEL